MLWPHTKKLVPTEAGYEFIDEMLTPPIAKHTVAFTTNSVPCIITPPLFEKIQELRPPKELNAVDVEMYGYKINTIYTKTPTLPSRIIPQSRA